LLSFYLSHKQFLLYQTVYRDFKTFSGFPVQFCLHLSETPHRHSLFATFTESCRLCLLFQRFQAVFPLFNALFLLQSRSFSAFTFYRSFTPYLIAVTSDFSRYTPFSVSHTDKQGNSTYRDKIQAERDVKKPSRPLRPCFRFSIRQKLLFASRFILSRQEKVFSPAIDDDTRFLRIFLHLRRFQRSLPMFSTFPHISFHKQTITPLLTPFAHIKKRAKP